MLDIYQPNLADPSQGGLVRSRTAPDVIAEAFWWQHPLDLGTGTPPQVFDGLTTGTASGTSPVYAVRGRNRFTWQLTGTWAGTVNVQGSLDGVTFVDLDSGQTANGVYTTSAFVDYIQFSVTLTSGAVVCVASAVRDA
ncbi:MAG TPA: hypothetical protein VK066_12285 [Chloroflexota bacterium]|nr:hypothetical protein [Chloroflexota bacterium]